jgi:Tfp pilus assembly protein PilF
MTPFQTVLPARPTPVGSADPMAQVMESLTRAEQCAQSKRMHEAMGICRDVLEAVPEQPAAMALLGSILGHQGEMGQAIDFLERACARNNQVSAWHNNLCSLYRMDCRLDEAETAGRAALALAPGQAPLLLNLGKVHMDRNDWDQAIGCFLDVLARDAQNAEAHLAIGQILLSRGELQPGWLEYEWRNRLDAARGMIPDMVRPEWNGMPLPNGTVMLIGDQGYGDTLQFARYIPQVAQRCREVVMACGAELESLLSRQPGVVRTFNRWQDAPEHTVWCRLSSLGGIFSPNLDSIPVSPAYITADPAEVANWAERLDGLLPRRRLRVGLFWAGRPTHPNDRRRSLRLAQLAPLTSQGDIDFISLQKQMPPQDAATVAALPNLRDVGPQLENFSTTAAVLANLDLLVTVDSAVAHLAGALGRPVCVLIGAPADWRWMHGRDDTPWYPSMRLVRQPSPGVWGPAIATVSSALERMALARVPEPV